LIKKILDKPLIQQILKFGVVGFLCFFIEYGLLILLRELLGMPVRADSSTARIPQVSIACFNRFFNSSVCIDICFTNLVSILL